MLSRHESHRALPLGQLAPGLVLTSPLELGDMLATGEHVGYVDFVNACDGLGVGATNGTRAFNSVCEYLARGACDTIRRDLAYGLHICFKPAEGARNYLAVATQELADMIVAHETQGLDTDNRILTARSWRVAGEVLRDEGDDPWAERYHSVA